METFSALLAICAGNSSVPGEFPAQKPVTRSFDVFFDLCLRWVNNGEAGDLRRHRAHYDVIAMISGNVIYAYKSQQLHWCCRHPIITVAPSEHHDVTNRQLDSSLFNSLLRLIYMKISELCVTGWERNSRLTRGFSPQKASKADIVSMSWHRPESKTQGMVCGTGTGISQASPQYCCRGTC